MVPFHIDIGRLPDSLDDLDQPWREDPLTQPAPASPTGTEHVKPKREPKKARKSAPPAAPDETEDEGLSSVPATPASKLPARGTALAQHPPVNVVAADVPAALFTPPAASSKAKGKRKADEGTNIYDNALEDYRTAKRARHVEITADEAIEPDSDNIADGVRAVLRSLYKQSTGIQYIDTSSPPFLEPAQLDRMLEVLDGYEANGTVIPAVTQEIRNRLLQVENVYQNDTNVLNNNKLSGSDLQTINGHQSVQSFSCTQQEEIADTMNQVPVTFSARGALDHDITTNEGTGKQQANTSTIAQQLYASHQKLKHSDQSEAAASDEDPIPPPETMSKTLDNAAPPHHNTLSLIPSQSQNTPHFNTQISTIGSQIQIFAPDGNRKKGYRCVPCILYKKGCKGNPPVCDTCKQFKRPDGCSFDPVKTAEAVRIRKEKESGTTQQSSSPAPAHTTRHNTSSRMLGKRKRGEDQSESEQDINGHTQATNSLQHEARQLQQHALNTPTEPRSDTVMQAVDNTYMNHHIRSQNERRALITQAYAAPTSAPQTRQQRINQQKRTVKVLSRQDIDTIREPFVRVFLRSLPQPVSRSLLPMINDICLAFHGTSDVQLKDRLPDAKKYFNDVWDLVLANSSPEADQLAEQHNLTREQKIAWLRRGSPCPRTEREVEEFFFAFVCMVYNPRDEPRADERARHWYKVHVEQHWDYLWDSMRWHEQMRTSYEMRINWLRDWLKSKDAEERRAQVNWRAMVESQEVMQDTDMVDSIEAEQVDTDHQTA